MRTKNKFSLLCIKPMSSGFNGNSPNNNGSNNSPTNNSSGPTGPTGSNVGYTGMTGGSWNHQGLSGLTGPVIVNLALDQELDLSGAVVHNRTGTDISGNQVTQTTFVTTDESLDVNITQNLNQTVVNYYDDESDPNSATGLVMNQIKDYALQINCSSFQGKGTIDDYQELFVAASKIANESQQMTLAVDISGFNEFGSAADELSKLFNGFILKLQNVSIVNDLAFLQSIAAALAKIVNLSNVFGKFKETIFATTKIEVPKSSHDATVLVSSVMTQLNCAMNYINYFVDPESQAAPAGAELSVSEQNLISNAISTIDRWNVLCAQDVSVAMSNSADMQYIKNASQTLASQTHVLQRNTSTLKGKLRGFNLF